MGVGDEVKTPNEIEADKLKDAVYKLADTMASIIPSYNTIVSGGNQLEDLRRELSSKTNIYNSASGNLAKAEKNYILAKEGGTNEYNTLINDRILVELDAVGNVVIDDYRNNMIFIDQMARQFKSETLSLRNAKIGYNNLLIENAILTKKLDAYSKILNTNERKSVYEIQNMKNLYTYRRVLFFIYYLCIASYILFGDFIPKKLYTDYTYLVVLLILIVFPFILNTIISWTIICINAIHYWLDDSIIQDVYDKLDKTVQSSDIISNRFHPNL